MAPRSEVVTVCVHERSAARFVRAIGSRHGTTARERSRSGAHLVARAGRIGRADAAPPAVSNCRPARRISHVHCMRRRDPATRFFGSAGRVAFKDRPQRDFVRTDCRGRPAREAALACQHTTRAARARRGCWSARRLRFRRTSTMGPYARARRRATATLNSLLRCPTGLIGAFTQIQGRHDRPSPQEASDLVHDRGPDRADTDQGRGSQSSENAAAASGIAVMCSYIEASLA